MNTVGLQDDFSFDLEDREGLTTFCGQRFLVSFSFCPVSKFTVRDEAMAPRMTAVKERLRAMKQRGGMQGKACKGWWWWRCCNAPFAPERPYGFGSHTVPILSSVACYPYLSFFLPPRRCREEFSTLPSMRVGNQLPLHNCINYSSLRYARKIWHRNLKRKNICSSAMLTIKLDQVRNVPLVDV